MRPLIAWLVSLASAAALAEPSIEAHVDSQAVTTDDTVTLQVSIEAPQGYERYEPPSLSDFVVVDTGRQTQTEIVMQGGRLQSRSTEMYTYSLRARRTGDLSIGVARLRAGGRVYESRGIVVEVSAGAGSGSPLPPAPQEDVPGALTEDPEGENLFLQVTADETEVWVGQQVNVTWSLYAQSDVLDYRPTKDPATDAFWSENLYAPSLRLEFKRQVIAGKLFQVAPVLRKALFPLRGGELTIGSMEVELGTVGSRLRGSGPVARRTPEISVRAKPLPADGRPAGFSPSNVGRFAIEARADRTQVQAGEPIGLRVLVRGTGNIRGLEVPPLRTPDFKIYAPRVEDRVEAGDVVEGEKRIDYALLPVAGGELTIPALTLPYFDPVSATYAVVRTQPIAITVIGDPNAVGLRGPESQREILLAKELRPIRHRVDLRRKVSRLSTFDRLFPLLVVAPPIGYLAFVGIGLVRVRRLRDTPAGRRRRTMRQARARLRTADRYLREGNAAGFYAEITRALHETLSEPLGRRVEGLTREELSGLLFAQAGHELAAAVLRELDNCDFGRFAPSEQREGEMKAALVRAQDLLDGIERIA